MTWVPLIKEGPDALKNLPGVSMDEEDRRLYWYYFVKIEKRNPTIVEMMDLNNANSEHSRHGFFKGRLIIDGKLMPKSLLDMLQEPLQKYPGNSILAFKDNSSAIAGYVVNMILPRNPGHVTSFKWGNVTCHFIFTA
jgi:phosphoribosylformylglycinamidine synthase